MDLLELFNSETLKNKLINELAENIQKRKEDVIFMRMCTRIKGVDLSSFSTLTKFLEKEATKTFPRIKCVYGSIDQSEHWYWNDGSIKGLHLVSFYLDNDFGLERNQTITSRFKYV